MQNKVESKISNEQYEELISKTIDNKNIKEKSIVTGKVVSVEKFPSVNIIKSIFKQDLRFLLLILSINKQINKIIIITK